MTKPCCLACHVFLTKKYPSYPKTISRSFCRKIKRVKLVVVGDGPYLQDLKDLVAELGIEEAVILQEWSHMTRQLCIIRQVISLFQLLLVRHKD